MKRPVYLDYNATTPVDPRVVEAMVPFFTEHYGNASSKGHAFGWAAAEAVKIARASVADLMGADSAAVYFTGGATESLNTAIKGVATTYRKKGNHIVTVKTEHKGVLNACKVLAREGIETTMLDVDVNGLVDPDELEAAITEETILVSVMWANNETGVIQPVRELASRVRSRGILFMTDATQAYGKIPVDASEVDLFTCTAHKLYGPKGIGGLFVRKRNPRVRLVPLIDGGSQEDGMRAGTTNVPGIVGFGAAARIATEEGDAEASRLATLRDRFEQQLTDALPFVKINGGGAPRLPHVSNLAFPGVTAANLVTELRSLAMSTGSACSTGTGNPSHVLKAMGLTDAEAYATLRISFGRFTTEEEVEFATGEIIEKVNYLHAKVAVTNP
ncbi:MAG: cysteine desulfurase family protein [Bacteroidota bacterium]